MKEIEIEYNIEFYNIILKYFLKIQDFKNFYKYYKKFLKSKIKPGIIIIIIINKKKKKMKKYI
jgi:pentatricopeptide repeat protein